MLNIQPGDRLQIAYPKTTDVRRIRTSRRVKRSIVIQDVRDLSTKPLTATEFLRRPYCHRGRWLVRATDVRKRKDRKFYLGVTQEFASPALLRIGVVAHGEAEPTTHIGGYFTSDQADRDLMVRLINRWNLLSIAPRFGKPPRLKVFAYDAGIICEDCSQGT